MKKGGIKIRNISQYSAHMLPRYIHTSAEHVLGSEGVKTCDISHNQVGLRKHGDFFFFFFQRRSEEMSRSG